MSNNSSENRRARLQYREYYLSQSKEMQSQLPAPEREEDISGMDGNWVFPVNEASMGSTAGDTTSQDIDHHEDTDAYYEGKHTETEQGGVQYQDHTPTHTTLTDAQHKTYTEDEVQEVVRRVVMAMQLTEAPEALFQARCILIAFGIGEPPTESELARTKNCSRQFVSKKVKRIQQLFKLSPSQFMRSDRACKAYSRAYYKYKSNNKTEPRPAKPPTEVKESIMPSSSPLGNRHRPSPRRGVVGSKTTSKVIK